MGKRRIPQRIELHSIPKHRSWLNMTQSLARTEMVKRLCEAAVQDDRIVGLVDFGSGGQGRIDEWSDIDAALILRGTDYYAFQQGLLSWARQFGEILLSSKGTLVPLG